MLAVFLNKAVNPDYRILVNNSDFLVMKVILIGRDPAVSKMPFNILI